MLVMHCNKLVGKVRNIASLNHIGCFYFRQRRNVFIPRNCFGKRLNYLCGAVCVHYGLTFIVGREINALEALRAGADAVHAEDGIAVVNNPQFVAHFKERVVT